MNLNLSVCVCLLLFDIEECMEQGAKKPALNIIIIIISNVLSGMANGVAYDSLSTKISVVDD